MIDTSRPDFEFGELSGKIETLLDEIRAPTMMIRDEDLSELQNSLIRMTIMAKNWIGSGRIIGCLDSISSIVEELLKPNYPVLTVDNETKQRLLELFADMQVEIKRAYAVT
ncbi:hypothetical protein MUP77_04700 [Candidatus Bathyarchaeota archaeon]|nr:hypothetical protein [Candidatus Bathyarchaeota archaeon]